MDTNLQLTAEERLVLENLYGKQTGGYNPHKLDAVKNLSAHEEKFFDSTNFVSPHFFVHTLYKVSGSVSPIKFNLAVTKLIDETENLRANFCNLGTRTVKVIRPAATVKPEIIFRNLANTADLDDDFRKIFEADSRRDVDLERDPLIRFAVYKTSDADFAVLVTLAQIIADSFDDKKFFAQVTGVPLEIDLTLPDEIPPQNLDTIREYWTKILDNPPPIAGLPYEKETSTAGGQKVFHTTIPADLVSDIDERTQGNQMMLSAILHGAWGFMLQLINKQRDCLFCQIFSSDMDGNSDVIPVRMTCDDDSTVEQIIRGQFRQIIISKPYSLDDWTALSDLTGQHEHFDHFIKFVKVSPQGLTYFGKVADPHGEIIFRGSWITRGMKLGTYFYFFKKNLTIGCLYDAETFSDDGIERLCELYKLILRQMFLDWSEKYSDFMERLAKRLEIQSQPEETSEQIRRKKIRNFLSQLPILQSRFEGTIDLFADLSELVTLYEGDRISADMLEKRFIFVADGILSRTADTGDGWYNTLDIIEKNAFVNPTYLLERRPFTLSATVLTERAELLTIPHDAFTEILGRNAGVTLSVMNYALEQMARYQTLWLNASVNVR